MPLKIIPNRSLPWQSLNVAEAGLVRDEMTEITDNDMGSGMSELEALRLRCSRSEARLKSILETAVEGIISINERGLIQDMNPAAEEIFGYPGEEVVGKNVSILMPEPFQSQHDGYLQAYQKTGEAKIIGFGREVLGKRRNGEIFAMDLSVSEIHVGEGRLFFGFVRDISERKELEKEVLAISDRERVRIGHDLHDDLGQQLTGIEFMCQTLEQSLKAREVPEAASAGEISGLVRSAIAHTRRLARGLSPVIVDGGGLVQALEELASATAQQYGVSCEFRCPRRFVIDDEAAAGHLYRIAQEAVQNAMKHGKPTRIEVGLTRTPEHLALSVHDNGTGIRKRTGKHAGMGLRVMGYRAGLIGGSLAVQRNESGGTTVLCTVHQRTRAANYEI